MNAVAGAVSPFSLALRRFLGHRMAVGCGLFLVLVALLVAAAPFIAAIVGIDPEQVNLLARFQPPSAAHLLGTDELGRDLLLRLLLGGQVSLLIGLTGALTAAIIGTAVGLVAGFIGGRLDDFLMRLTDSVIALPVLPLLIVLAAIDLEKAGIPEAIARSEHVGLIRITVIVALFGWVKVARLVRAAALAARDRDYVLAARSLGASRLRIMALHILPNAAGPIVVATTLSVGNVILLESVLSFLGLGIQPPVPSWGNMLTNAQELIWTAPMLAILPGLAIFLTVIAVNFLGDGLQDALDPRSERR
ncbi:MAG: ABC transporter permease [Rhodospirillales bacterium]